MKSKAKNMDKINSKDFHAWNENLGKTKISKLTPTNARALTTLVDVMLTNFDLRYKKRKNFQNTIGLFLQHLYDQRGHLLPPKLQEKWKPFAKKKLIGFNPEFRKAENNYFWKYIGPTSILWLVDKQTINEFRKRRKELGDDSKITSTRLKMIIRFMRFAFHAGLLKIGQSRELRLFDSSQCFTG
jgi:hypothetical protein